MDKTYLCIGKFDNQQIDMDIILPKHSKDNPYDFGFVTNISKQINNKSVFAICLTMRKFVNNVSRLYNGDTLYPFKVSISSIINQDYIQDYINAIELNLEEAEKIYVFVLHDDDDIPNQDYIKNIFDNLNLSINEVESKGQPFVWSFPMSIKKRPRVVGVSIIRP